MQQSTITSKVSKKQKTKRLIKNKSAFEELINHMSQFDNWSDSLKFTESILRYRVNRLAKNNLILSGSRALLGLDLADENNEKKIIKRIKMIYTKDYAKKRLFPIVKLVEKVAKKEKAIYLKRDRIEAQIGEYYNTPISKKSRKILKRIPQQLTNTKQDWKFIKNLGLLKTIDNINSISSIVGYFKRDSSKDDNRVAYYAKFGEMVKGSVELGLRIPELTRKTMTLARRKIPLVRRIARRIIPVVRRIIPQRLLFKRSLQTIGKRSFLKNAGNGTLKFLGRTASRAVGILSFGADMMDVYNEKNQNEKARKLAGAATGAALGWGGAQLGAMIGTAIAPGVGTLIGGALGGAIGYVLGSGIGRKIGNRFKKPILNVWNKVEKFTRPVVDPFFKVLKQGTKLLDQGYNGAKKIIRDNVKNITNPKFLKSTVLPLATLAIGNVAGLNTFLVGKNAISYLSNIAKKQKKSEPIQLAKQTKSETSPKYIDCRQVAAQMISELNKVLQNKVISHTANYA